MILSLKDKLHKTPYEFEFTQTIRLLYKMNPNAIPLGTSGTPQHEALTLKSRVFLSAPPSDIFTIKQNPSNLKPEVHVNFMGIAGIQGPLPLAYTELLISRLRKKDQALRDFLDIFNHRLLSLRYRIEQKYHQALQEGRPDETSYGKCLKSFLGWDGSPEIQDLIPQNLLLYTTSFWQKPRNCIALQKIIQDFFQTETRIFPFEGDWISLEKEQCTYLGRQGLLGHNSSLGKRVWCQNHGILIDIKIKDFQLYCQFLPGKQQKSFIQLKNLITLYLGPALGFKITLSLQENNISKLGSSNVYLGFSSWIGKEGNHIHEVRDNHIQIFQHKPEQSSI